MFTDRLRPRKVKLPDGHEMNLVIDAAAPVADLVFPTFFQNIKILRVVSFVIHFISKMCTILHVSYFFKVTYICHLLGIQACDEFSLKCGGIYN